MLTILTTPAFARVAKKLHPKDKAALDKAIAEIRSDPLAGEGKRGDLAGLLVFKCKMNRQDYLLAYQLAPHQSKPKEIHLLALGTHENFYRDLKSRQAP